MAHVASVGQRTQAETPTSGRVPFETCASEGRLGLAQALLLLRTVTPLQRNVPTAASAQHTRALAKEGAAAQGELERALQGGCTILVRAGHSSCEEGSAEGGVGFRRCRAQSERQPCDLWVHTRWAARASCRLLPSQPAAVQRLPFLLYRLSARVVLELTRVRARALIGLEPRDQFRWQALAPGHAHHANALYGPRGSIGAMREQELNRFDALATGGVNQWSVPTMCRGVHISSMLEQQRHHLRIAAPLSGEVHGPLAVAVDNGHICTRGDEHSSTAEGCTNASRNRAAVIVRAAARGAVRAAVIVCFSDGRISSAPHATERTSAGLQLHSTCTYAHVHAHAHVHPRWPV